MKLAAFFLLLVFSATCLSAKETAVKKPKENKQSPEQRAERDRKDLEKFEREDEEAGRLSKQMKKDQRKPSKTDVSGNWSTGPNLVGIDFQLEQHGEKVTGRGYAWGCLHSSPIKIVGTHHRDLLVLTVTSSEGERYTLRMTYAEEEHYPRFDSTGEQSWPSIRTAFEINEREAKEK